MHMLAEYALYLAETLTFVIAALLLFGGLIAIASKNKQQGKLKVTQLNQSFNDNSHKLADVALDKKAQKKLHKKIKQQEKNIHQRPRLFVLRFKGDMFASAVEALREEVNAILMLATPQDSVLVCVESPGGVVPGYGLAAAQLQRFKDKNIPLTVSVDKVAASGGYLMACVADKIIASSFAIIGSIGVLSQLPNFHRLTQKTRCRL